MPAIVKAESIMKIIGFEPVQSLYVPNKEIILLGTEGHRVFTAMAHSEAALHATLDGLPLLRKYTNAKGQEMIDYALPKLAPRHGRKLLWQ